MNSPQYACGRPHLQYTTQCTSLSIAALAGQCSAHVSHTAAVVVGPALNVGCVQILQVTLSRLSSKIWFTIFVFDGLRYHGAYLLTIDLMSGNTLHCAFELQRSPILPCECSLVILAPTKLAHWLGVLRPLFHIYAPLDSF